MINIRTKLSLGIYTRQFWHHDSLRSIVHCVCIMSCIAVSTSSWATGAKMISDSHKQPEERAELSLEPQKPQIKLCTKQQQQRRPIKQSVIKFNTSSPAARTFLLVGLRPTGELSTSWGKADSKSLPSVEKRHIKSKNLREKVAALGLMSVSVRVVFLLPSFLYV